MRFLSGLFTVAAVGALILGGVALGGKQMFEAEGPLEETLVFEIPRGAGLDAIANRLETESVISSSAVFRAAALITGVEGDLKAGDYQFEPGVTMKDVLARVTSGASISYSVTIIEGSTVADAIAVIEAAEFLEGEIERVPAEGMLAAQTHNFRRGEQRQAVVDFFEAEQERTLAELWENRAEGLPYATPEDALVLASIVEKETASAAEYPIVASVFVNRLAQNEPLGVDAAVIYGLVQRDGAFNGNLTSANLTDRDNDWNLRVHRGLPPTAIANPGRAAIEAVLDPAETDCLFFVADGTGGHAFGRSNAEHGRHVRRWGRIERVIQTDGVWTLDVAPIRRLFPSQDCDAEVLAASPEATRNAIRIEEGMTQADVIAAVESADFLEGAVTAATSGDAPAPGLYRVRRGLDRQFVAEYLLSAP